MQTVAQTTAPSKAFRCTIYDEPGVLAQCGGQITFFRDSDSAIIDFEVEMAPFTCVLGEVGLSEAARVLDTMHGGPAAICTSRQMEVR
jgi:hypothetical protein